MGKKNDYILVGFRYFFRFPVLMPSNKEFTYICDKTLSNAIFDKLYWHIRDCFEENDLRFKAFIGRPYERYIQLITKMAIEKRSVYTFIDEFEFSSKHMNSSDAYIISGDKLIIVEAKSLTPYFESLSKGREDLIKNSINKLFIDPVLQANEAYKGIMQSEKHELFKGIKEVYIISVTIDNVQAVPVYINHAIEEIRKKVDSSTMRYFFNLNVEEYETLLFHAENGVDIFEMLSGYFNEEVLSPFSNYLMKKTGINQARTVYMNRVLEESMNEIMRTLHPSTFGK